MKISFQILSSHVKLASYRVSLPIQPTLEFHPLKKNCYGAAYRNGHRRYQYVINLFMAAISYLMHGKVINTSIHSRMAAFKGMLVSPAKHNDEKGGKMTSSKCDYRTDTQVDRQTRHRNKLFLCTAMFRRQSNKVALGNSFSILYTGKISPRFIFALWPEGEFKIGLIELYIKGYIRKLGNGRIQDLANQFQNSIGRK